MDIDVPEWFDNVALGKWQDTRHSKRTPSSLGNENQSGIRELSIGDILDERQLPDAGASAVL